MPNTRTPNAVRLEFAPGSLVHGNLSGAAFTGDWLFPTSESRAIVHSLNAVAAIVSFVEIESDKGHDAFLLEEPEFAKTLAGFLAGSAAHRGLK